MKISRSVLRTVVCLPALLSLAQAAPVPTLKGPHCDAAAHIIYDGAGHFALDSAAATELRVTIDTAALTSYLGSNDYKSGPAVTWELSNGSTTATYGLADTPQGITGYWQGKNWGGNGSFSWADLRKHAAADGTVTLLLSNDPAAGIMVCALSPDGTRHPLYTGHKLKSSLYTTFRTTAIRVNSNYITSADILTPSTLDTATWTPPADYTRPFVSTRKDGTSLGRIMFLGDSITHGVYDMSYRWQLFKILVDNGYEFEIVGPRSGYTPGYIPTARHTSDCQGAESTYAGLPFPNVHLAQSSGRTHNIISGSNSGMTGVNYGGHSTASSADSFNCNTFICMMGTNDLLSDRGYSPREFAGKMERLLGGKVTGSAKSYRRTGGKAGGHMGTIARDVLRDPGDTLVVLAVPTWGKHSNNNEPDRHIAVREYNALLRDWCAECRKAYPKCRILFVDVNKGLVDHSHPTPFQGHDSFFRLPGADGLHPGEQGSLIIAGNLATALRIPGRTLQLPRLSPTAAGTPLSLSKGKSHPLPEHYTLQLPLPATATLTLPTGSLSITPHHISWGDKVLYCRRPSRQTERLTITSHPVNPTANIRPGTSIWIGDTLIGQSLPTITTSPALTTSHPIKLILHTTPSAPARE